ncbi:hypothetical protein DPMN_152079 [Dreissena polymorpha]|uniref:Uncharacterized protein n=1 Tax=Dreissena polymorpha TaxID=45954 RepID=A0A9D4FL55_DREPO|nr:hypothetical protein DPMN_152079 [Dreissena polymorpha]
MLLLVILFRPLLSVFQHCKAEEIPENYVSFENASNEQQPAPEGAVHLTINNPLTGGEMTVANAYAMGKRACCNRTVAFCFAVLFFLFYVVMFIAEIKCMSKYKSVGFCFD